MRVFTMVRVLSGVQAIRVEIHNILLQPKQLSEQLNYPGIQFSNSSSLMLNFLQVIHNWLDWNRFSFFVN